MKRIFAAILSVFCWGCSHVSSSEEFESMNLHLGNPGYAELVDFLYDYAADNRLNVLWFGWYRVDSAKHWYERSDKDSNFKIKLSLLAEENGYIYVGNHFDEALADVVINYGDKKSSWLAVVDDFKKALASKGWRLEPIN